LNGLSESSLNDGSRSRSHFAESIDGGLALLNHFFDRIQKIGMGG